MSGMKKVVVSMGELPKGPKIYAATHTYSAEDVEFAISTAGESVYLMTMGDWNYCMMWKESLCGWLG